MLKGNGRFYDKSGTFFPDETGYLWTNEYLN